MKTTIDVTREDIATAQPGNTSCPIARAIKRIGLFDPYVGIGNVFVITGQDINGDLFTSAAMRLPDEAKRLISDFDQRRPVEPVSFEIDVPTTYLWSAR